jgi:DNA-binding MarR family transcriptional regulator
MSITTVANNQPSVAFLLAQIGAHASARFGARMASLDLSSPHAGILWNLANSPGMTQRELAELLGAFPSRLVLLLDELEKKGLLKRRTRSKDRRSYALALTREGKAKLDRVRRIAEEHQEELCAGLSDAERAELRKLLVRIANQQQLRPGVHPGYRTL